MPAIHIYFPHTIFKDPSNSQSSPMSISGIGQTISTAGSPTFEIDQTLTYNELCQIYLCFLIKFDSSSNILPGPLKVDITNLLNPESIATTGDITVTTLMKYTADSIYYKIDTFTGASNFNAVPGTMEAAKMQVLSLSQKPMTSVLNQIY